MAATRKPEVSGSTQGEFESVPIPAVLERISLILSAFDDPTSCLQVAAIANRSGLPKSTAHRLVNHLLHLGWLRRSSGGYVLGERMRLANSPGNYFDIRSAAAPLLHALQSQSGTVVHLGVLDGSQVVLLDKLGGRDYSSVPTNVGDRLPLHGTALGKAVLAGLTPEHVDELLPTQLDCRTPRTIANRETLHAELARVRGRHGVSYDRGEFAADLCCVAASIRCADGEMAAVSISAYMALETLTRMVPLLRDIAHRTGVRLGRNLQADDGNGRSAAEEVDLTMMRMLNTLTADDWL